MRRVDPLDESEAGQSPPSRYKKGGSRRRRLTFVSKRPRSRLHSLRLLSQLRRSDCGKWRRPARSRGRRDPATNELGSFPWQKWDMGSQSSKVYSLSPSHPELLTDGFEIQLKGWGAGVEVAAILALHLVAMSSGPGWKMKQSVSGVRYFFFFLNPPQLFTSGTQWFWCDLLFSEPLKHLGSCWVWLNYNRRRENNAANQTEYI